MEIQVNRRKFEVPDGETMAGGAIAALAGDGRDWVLWEVIPGHDDREVGEYEVLTMPVGGYRRFFTAPRFITAGTSMSYQIPYCSKCGAQSYIRQQSTVYPFRYYLICCGCGSVSRVKDVIP